MTCSERLFELIGGIDDKFITENEPKENGGKSRLPLILSLSTACAAAVAGFFLIKGALPVGGEIPYATVTSEATASTSCVPGTILPGETHSPQDMTPADPAGTAGTMAAVTTGTTAGVTSVTQTEEGIDTAVPGEQYIPVEINYDSLPFEYSGGELKKINAGSPYSGGMGYEGMRSKTAAELIGPANPWNISLTIDELPVFRGPGLPPVADVDICLAALQRIADALGEELTDVEYLGGGLEYADDPEIIEQYKGKVYGIDASAGSAKLSLYCEGDINIYIHDPEIPDWWEQDVESFEMAERTLLYLAEKYSALLGYTEWDVETRDYGYAHSQVIKHSDDTFEAIMNYNFKRARLLILDNKIIINITDTLGFTECEGMYPTISWREALERVKNSEYTTTAPSEVLPDLKNEPDRVKAVEMIYRMTSDYGHYIPYYRFIVLANTPDYEQEWLKEGESLYTAVYVPVIAPEYIADANTSVGFNQ